MTVYVLAFLIGVVAGLRSMTAPAVLSWGVRLGWVPLEATRLAFLGNAFVPWLLTLLAVGELVADKLPKTPSRKAPGPFIVRIVVGACCGGALGLAKEQLWAGVVCGAVGAVVGTLGGYEFRSRLVKATGGKDLPIALMEDMLAIGGAFWIVSQF